ncbi:MAG: hypothetical protein EBT13_18535 [Rhodobacteraceae bacterium]|nr:hypothetical protein [Paracoccaceae bacterium]
MPCNSLVITSKHLQPAADMSNPHMKPYLAIFTGRHVGAIGVFERHACWLMAESPDDASLRLYDHYEHIRALTVLDENDGRAFELAQSVESLNARPDFTAAVRP